MQNSGLNGNTVILPSQKDCKKA